MKILIIGGTGYIGSALFLHLTRKFTVDTVDLEHYGNAVNSNNYRINFNQLEKSLLEKFDAIILLAGNSSVKSCESRGYESFKNNVCNFVELLSKLNKKQKFIYASSSSVYGNTRKKFVTEDYRTYIPHNFYDLSKNMIDNYVSLTDINYFGLRFGTVCGFSPNLRVDVMINAMFESYKINKHIKLFNPEINRPILGLTDLCRAVETILVQDKTRGIYNLASFNSTSEEIAKEFSKKLNCPIKLEQPNHQTTSKLVSTAYNFSIDSKKFEKEFTFTFKDDTISIIDQIQQNYHLAKRSVRN